MYLTGFDPAFARRSPGAILYADAIERAHARGDRVFDFMRGAEAYKYRWGARDLVRLHRCRFAQRASASQSFAQLPDRLLELG